MSRTYTDGQGRTTETRTPLDSSNDLVQFTVYDDANDSQFQSVPFRYPRSVGGWVDPATATIDHNGSTKPAGATVVTDALGRTRAMSNAIVGSASEPGISCGGLSGTWSTCNAYSYGYAYGDSNIYDYTASLDANDHQTSSFTDALGHNRFDYWYSVAGSVSSNITTKRVTQYDALGDVTSVQEKDLAPQSGESTVSVTATATYDSLGRQTGVSDPDRGNHTYSYDADGRLITDVSGTRTIGVSYDILGRTRCVQDAAPPNNGSGSCSSGAHALVQNLYGSSVLQLPGTTDYAMGRLTQSIATT